jgi:hypothetical protein
MQTEAPSPLLSDASPVRARSSAGLKRAQAHSHRPLTLLALLALTAGLGGCDQAGQGDREATAASSAAAVGLVDRLVELSTPLDPTLTSDHHDRQLHARRALLDELRASSEAVGHEALTRFKQVEASPEEAPVLVRVYLLDVASHAATQETEPLLEELTLQYGHKMDIRTEAMLLLGQVAPERAVTLLEPLLVEKRTSTMPADEFMLKAYVNGCEGSGHDPVPILVDIATNIFKEDAARHLAVQELGKHKELLAQQALRAILVESTGNAYLRRKAAQSMRATFAREQACAIFREVASKEADMHFQRFIEDMIRDNCE